MKHTNSIERIKLKWLAGITAGVALSMSLGACSGKENNNNTAADPCEEVSVDGEDYCVWRGQNIIIETGYICPQTFSFRHEFPKGQDFSQDLIVCSGSMTPPTIPIIERIHVQLGQAPVENNTTQGRSCANVEADYSAAFEALPTSCMVDADCEYINPGLECGCGAAVSASADKQPFTDLYEEYRGLDCHLDDPICGFCMQGEPRCDQGVCVATQQNGGRTCDDLKADFAAAYDALPRTCQTTADCAYGGTNSCGIAKNISGGCQIALSSDADRSVLDPLVMEYDALGCGAMDPPCSECAALPVVCNDQGMCETTPETPDPVTCESLTQDYRDTVDAVDRTCQADSDCEVVVGDCHMSAAEDRCTLAVNASADISGLMVLTDEYDALDCRATQGQCMACEPAEAKCNAQGMCEAVAAQARTCDDIRADYATVYAAFPRTCQTSADCEYGGTNACGLSNGVAGGCQIALSAGTDRSALDALAMEYSDLGCNAQDPACAQCEALAVECSAEGMCVTTQQ